MIRAAIKLSLIILFSIYGFRINAQLTIDFPLNRSVFQRVNNQADIQIGGTTQMFLHEIQVRLIVRNGGVARDWTTINTNVQIGQFRGVISNVQAGWYELEMRGLIDGYEVINREVERVGVGEVFIIAGQSNAQGGRNTPDYATQIYYGAQDDRVNGINWSTDDENEVYPLPLFEKIQAETDIAPTGKASWCYALLGDKIVQNWNVPVLFFNAGIEATSINAWSVSANYGTFPYLFFKKALQYYTKIYGVRAVLWHQGENDYYNVNADPQTSAQYINDLTNLINKSRADFHPNLSWVISKVSMLYGQTNPYLISCQETCATTPNTNRFLGPYTDPIQPNFADRDGAVHFRGTGFIELADAWFNSINTPNFINNSTPISGTNNLKIVNGQFEFGNSLPPCSGTNQSVNSGDWNNPNNWSCGAAPISLNNIIISQGHTINIENTNIYFKNLTINGTLNLGANGVLIRSTY